jgi:hypothetical protein
MKRILLFGKLLIVFLLVACSVKAEQKDANKDDNALQAFTWDAGDMLGNTMAKSGSTNPKPFSPQELKVSPGEKVTFQLDFIDVDRKRNKGAGRWTFNDLLDKGKGPWQIEMEVSGNATWEANGLTTFSPPPGKSADKVYLNVSNDWAAAGYPTITVTATITDNAPDPEPEPDEGTTRDPAYTVTWKFVRRIYIPKKEHYVTGLLGGDPIESSLTTGLSLHQADPAVERIEDDPPVTMERPYYENCIVNEAFAPVIAVFTLDDISDGWLMADPNRALMSANDIARAEIGSGANVSFTLGTFNLYGITKEDSFIDSFGGNFLPSQRSVFKEDSIVNKGIEYILYQTYTAGPYTLGSYKLEYKYQDGKMYLLRSLN